MAGIFSGLETISGRVEVASGSLPASNGTNGTDRSDKRRGVARVAAMANSKWQRADREIQSIKMTTNANHSALAEATARRGSASGEDAGRGTGGPGFEAFITKPEVARRLNKQVRTVDNWMKCGILPYYKIGRSVVFKWGEIETALAATCRVAR